MLGIVTPELVKAYKIFGVVIVRFFVVVGFHVLRGRFELFKVLFVDNLTS